MLTESERKACRKPYLSVRLVAKILGVAPRTATQWCEDNELFVNVGKRRKVAREKVRAAFPDAYRELMEEMYEAEEDNFKNL